MKNPRQIIKYGIAIVALLMLSAAIWRFGGDSRHASEIGRADPTAPVTIVLNNANSERPVTLHVPSAYLINAADRRGGTRVVVAVRAALPAMDPAPGYVDVPGTDPATVDPNLLAAINNAIDISIGPPAAPGSIFDVTAWRTQLTSSPHLRLQEAENFGLIRADDITCTPELRAAIERTKNTDQACVPSSYSWFVTQESDETSIFFKCVSGTSFRTGCSAYSSCSRVRVSYVFRKSQMAQWRYIHGNVCSLVESFMAPAVGPTPIDK